MRIIWRCEPGNLVDYRPWPTFHGICDERFEALRDALTAPLDAQDVGASVGVYLGELIVSNTRPVVRLAHVRAAERLPDRRRHRRTQAGPERASRDVLVHRGRRPPIAGCACERPVC